MSSGNSRIDYPICENVLTSFSVDDGMKTSYARVLPEEKAFRLAVAANGILRKGDLPQDMVSNISVEVCESVTDRSMRVVVVKGLHRNCKNDKDMIKLVHGIGLEIEKKNAEGGI